MKEITTGEQSISATGAVAGSLDTSNITGNFTVKVRVRGLTFGASMQVSIEDTASASAFSDAVNLKQFWFIGGSNPEGSMNSFQYYEVPNARLGSANNKLRANVTSLTSGATAKVYVWLEP